MFAVMKASRIFRCEKISIFQRGYLLLMYEITFWLVMFPEVNVFLLIDSMLRYWSSFHPNQLPSSQWKTGIPCGSDGKESACSAGDLGSILGSRRSPREWNDYLLTVFWPGESLRQRSLAGYSPYGCKELSITEQLTLSLSNGHTVFWRIIEKSSLYLLEGGGDGPTSGIQPEVSDFPPQILGEWGIKAPSFKTRLDS